MTTVKIESPYNIKEVLFQRKYAGYIYRRELVDDSEYGGNGNLEMVNCYSSDTGAWIGDAKDARMLCNGHGLTNIQKTHPGHSACSIGFNEDDEKWFGWSHRAIYGFGVGSVCKKGDCGYQPTDKNDFLKDVIRFWTEDDHLNIKGEHKSQKDENGVMEHGVYVEWILSNEILNKKMRGEISGIFTAYPSDYGKGEWEAKTLEDAKQMAIDFASGVS